MQRSTIVSLVSVVATAVLATGTVMSAAYADSIAVEPAPATSEDWVSNVDPGRVALNPGPFDGQPATTSERAQLSTAPGGPAIGVEVAEVPAPTPVESRTSVNCESQPQRDRASGQSTCVRIVSLEELERVQKLNPLPEVAIEEPELANRAMPAECGATTLPSNTWWAGSRREACAHYDLGIIVTLVPQGTVTGTAQLRVRPEMIATGTTWSNTLRVNVWSATGNGSPQSITAKLFGCAGCTSQTTFGPTGTGSWYGTGTFTKGGLVSGSVVGGLSGHWELTMANPAWSNPLVTTRPLATYRCDNAISGRAAGCVFSNIVAVAGFSGSTNPNFVSHVYRAQVSGLPGLMSSGTYLTRLTSSTLRDANGRRACPPELPRPDGWQCDEYPFRSTYQGASTSGATEARSHTNCAMTDPERTGPTGWSRCFIPAGQNASAGGILSGFYLNERVIDGEQFQVGYLP